MVDGLITKEDFKKQTNWHTKHLDDLNQELIIYLQNDKADNQQVNIIKQYILALNEIMNMDGQSELLYKKY
jgi:hypothetical protein